MASPVRVLLCDDHAVFAESLGHLLAASGVDVVAVTFNLNWALAEMRRQPVDVCMVDLMFGNASALDRLDEIRAAAPDVPIVLLSGRIDDALRAAARSRGVAAIADKRQPVAEIVALLGRVHIGATVRDTPPPLPSPRLGNDAQRLAAYLTPREREVVTALVRGTNTTSIAGSMRITEATARCHVQAVLTKLGAHSRLEAVTTAVRYGLVDPCTGEWLRPA